MLTEHNPELSFSLDSSFFSCLDLLSCFQNQQAKKVFSFDTFTVLLETLRLEWCDTIYTCIPQMVAELKKQYRSISVRQIRQKHLCTEVLRQDWLILRSFKLLIVATVIHSNTSTDPETSFPQSEENFAVCKSPLVWDNIRESFQLTYKPAQLPASMLL